MLCGAGGCVGEGAEGWDGGGGGVERPTLRGEEQREADVVRGGKGGSHAGAAGRSTRSGPGRQSSLRRDRLAWDYLSALLRESKTDRKKVVPDREARG